MQAADVGEEVEALLFDGGFGIGAGVVEAVEEHGEGFGGEGLDGFLEIFDGDLVCVSIGEFGD